jgi:hypothetical protein
LQFKSDLASTNNPNNCHKQYKQNSELNVLSVQVPQLVKLLAAGSMTGISLPEYSAFPPPTPFLYKHVGQYPHARFLPHTENMQGTGTEYY